MSNSTRFSKIDSLIISQSWLELLIGSQVTGLVESATVSVPLSLAAAVRSQDDDSAAAAPAISPERRVSPCVIVFRFLRNRPVCGTSAPSGLPGAASGVPSRQAGSAVPCAQNAGDG